MKGIINMRGAIFDVDGTLLDSMNMWFQLVVEFYKLHGRELSMEEALEYGDVTLEESVPVIIEQLGLEMTVGELIGELKMMAVKQYEDFLPLKEGAAEYMKKLHDEGVKIAIATSGYEELCKRAFTRLGVWQYIDACAFSAEVGVNKSNPDVYLLAAERLGVKPEDTTVYEDILKGIIGAKKGGFHTCAIYDSSNEADTEELKKTADNYITSWNDLLR